MIQLADLLHYLEHSPIGSVLIRDFKLTQFILVDDTLLKLGDLDDLEGMEPKCQRNSDCLVTVDREPTLTGKVDLLVPKRSLIGPMSIQLFIWLNYFVKQNGIR